MGDFFDSLPSLEELYGQLRAMEELVESDGWQYLVQIAKNQTAAREGTLRAPLESQDGVFLQEFVKGELSGIATFLALPESIVESLKQDIEMVKATQVEQEEESDG